MNISNLQLVMGEKKLVGSAIGGKKKIAEMLNFMATNNVKPIIELFDITEIKKAFEKLEKNELRFRAVLKL
jgi:D-arabinose 1-dehydrogenase-like Zn-dependent alcohol dehydrogenase